jgi:hypothetical protein
MTGKLLILGREPAAWAAIIQAIVMLAATFVFDWSSDTVAAVTLLAIAVLDTYVAYATKDTMLGVLVGLVKATTVCAAAFGYDWGPEKTAQVVTFVTVVVGFFQRTQTFPVGDPPKALPGAQPVSDVGSV